MAAAAVDPIQDILDNHANMSDFLEIEAQVDDPEQRSRIISSGFWDLQELQTKTRPLLRRFAASSGARGDPEELQRSQSSLKECCAS